MNQQVMHTDERSDNGGYKADGHATARHYKSETCSRGKKTIFSTQIMKKQDSYPLTLEYHSCKYVLQGTQCIPK